MTNACSTPVDDDDANDEADIGTADVSDACDPLPPFLGRDLGLLARVACLALALAPLPDFVDAALIGHDCHAGTSHSRHRYLPTAVDADEDLIAHR